ncbi:GDSL esterase/lipase [Mucuna pruriens]|uniref:GDSL esterase/lipase n=1 Tax=Mucuna pruriens TaxID=157652 RepID=A0A371H521_MUCPR|nr:GDSL esterase/lipase [Mucuna pruriens]
MRSMGYSSYFLTSLLLVVVFNVVKGQPLVPALFIFGDSVVDVGNNNHLYTIVKANFPPYGRDFKNHSPTGRFCNGKLASDYTAENLGFTSYPPAYLNLKAKGKNLLNGSNFASAASGYYDPTAKLYHTIPLSQQLEHYKECQNILIGIVGQSNASSIISGAIYLISAGNSDFIQNYYINPLLYKVYTADRFSDILIERYATFIQASLSQPSHIALANHVSRREGLPIIKKLQIKKKERNLYALGARRIGVTTLPPMGCLPAAITLFGSDSNQCVARLNNDAVNFNKKLNTTSQSLQKTLSGLKLVIFDIYQPLYDLVTKPSENGFFEARKACCGTGLLETSILCNQESIGTCANASEYVFWDGFHPSDAANKVLSDDLLAAGISLIS